MKVATLIGSAGTGKTTELLRVLEGAKAALGGSPFAVGFASMTRAARQEAVDRASLAWGVPADVLSRDGWFKTAHGVCYRQLAVVKGQMLDDKKDSQIWLANALKVDIRTVIDDDSGYAVYAGDKSAAAALNCWEVSRARIEPLATTIARMVRAGQEPPPFAQCKQFIERYEQAKRLENRSDFTDLLARYAGIHFDPEGFYEVEPEGELPRGVKAWIFDEAQDASALIDRVCRRLANGPEVLWNYVALDPFQCQPAGTPVLTTNGYKPIEDLDPASDSIIAFNRREGAAYGTGKRIRFARAFRDVDSSAIFEITFSDGTTSQCTSNHKWVVRTKNGSKATRFVQASNLIPGIHCVPRLNVACLERKSRGTGPRGRRTLNSSCEWVDIVSIRRLPGGTQTRVYSLEVERHHTYVTTNGIVTGNSIYGFAGSDAKHFLSWPSDKQKIMPKSYRCPAPILALGEKCLRSMHRGYFDRGVAPADHDGRISRGGGPSSVVPSMDPTKKTLILARCNYLLDDWADALTKKRMPFSKIKSKDGTNVMRGTKALWDLEHGEPVSGDDFACAIAELPSRGKDGPLLERGTKTLWQKEDTVRRWDVVFPGDLTDTGMTQAMVDRISAGTWADLVSGGEKWRNSAVKWGADLATRPQIRIGTIHSAKGMEADTVVLATTTTRRIEEGQRLDKDAFDEERRIEYVGVTRARRELVIATEPVDYRMNIRI